MEKFSIKIDLSSFFQDERKLVMVLVDPNTWKSVKCLQKRICELFDLEEAVQFTSDGFFLPTQEPIEIVRFCKELKAFVPKDTLDGTKKKKSKKHKSKREESDCEKSAKTLPIVDDTLRNKQKKRKHNSLDVHFVSSTPNNPKRMKSNVRASIKNGNKSSEITSTSEQMLPPEIPLPYTNVTQSNFSSESRDINDRSCDDNIISSHDKSRKSQQKQKLSYKNKSCVASDISAHDVSKKSDRNLSITSDENSNKTSLSHNTIVHEISRKSMQNPELSNLANSDDESNANNDISMLEVSRKSKQKLSKLVVENNSNENCQTFTERHSHIPSSTFLNASNKSKKSKSRSNNPFRDQSSNLKHIYFDELGDNSTSADNAQNKEQEPTTKIVFLCNLNGADSKKPRIFHIRYSTGTCEKSPKKQTLEIKENIILKPAVAENTENASETVNGPISKEDSVEKSIEIEAEIESIENEVDSSVSDALNNTASTAIDTTNIRSMPEESVQIDTSINSINKSINHSIRSPQNVGNNNDTKNGSVDLCADIQIDLSKNIRKKKAARKQRQSMVNTTDITISDTSDIEEIAEIIDLNESEDSCSKTSQNLSCSSIKVANIRSSCKDLDKLPNAEDILIFKIPFTNNHGNPDCTNFLAGKVERIQHRTKLIKLIILDGHSELPFVPVKYLEKYVDASISENEHLEIKFNDMIQPRIYVHKK